MFRNKTILITGASSGLGRSLAIAFSKEKANLALVSRNQTELEITKSYCDFNTVTLIGDVCDPVQCKEAIEKCISLYGTLDYLLVNAGISMWAKFDELTDPAIMKKIMDTNYLGAVNMIFYALPHLKSQNGMIVGISSIQGKIPVPYHSGYSASKHALDAFLDVLRLELQKEVAILTVSPGWIEDTNLKKNAYRLNQEPTRHQRDKLSLDQVTQGVMKAMIQKKSQLILPAKYRLLPGLKTLFPKLINYLILQYFKGKACKI